MMAAATATVISVDDAVKAAVLPEPDGVFTIKDETAFSRRGKLFCFTPDRLWHHIAGSHGAVGRG